MSHICVDPQVLDFYKRKLAEVVPGAMSSHRLEAMAYGFGFQKYAAFRSEYKDQEGDVINRDFSEADFLARLAELSGSTVSVVPGVVADIFSYRTSVAVKNGYSAELVEMLALGTGADSFHAKIYAHALCSEAMSPGGQIVMPEESVMSTLTSIPSSYRVDLTKISWVEQQLLERDPYRRHRSATYIFFTMSSWWITMGTKGNWGSFHIVDTVEMAKAKAGARITVNAKGAAYLRAAQEELDSLRKTTEPEFLQKTLAARLLLLPD